MTHAPWPILALIAVLGLAIGSFLNVVVYRVPRGESIAFPGSHCPRCHVAIKARHNVPVLGWLILRGRCASCTLPISARYPLVEAGTAALMVAITVRFGLTLELPAYLFLATIALTLALIDADLRMLPDTIVLPAYVVTALLFLPALAAHGDWHPAGRAVVGLVALCAVYFALQVATHTAINGGDVKLAGLLGLYLGWLSWAALVIGAALGLLAGLALAVSVGVARRRRNAIAVAYGPCMIAGAGLALFVTVPMVSWYVSILGAA